MKKIKFYYKKFIAPLFKNKKHEQEKRRIKSLFRLYFEGWNHDDEIPIAPEVDIPISTLGITDIKYKFTNQSTTLIVTLQRPGLLIGKHGTTIDGLQKYLSNGKQVNIEIKESKLWL